MFGYIISNKDKINVKKYKIQSFDILHKTDLNIFVIENNKVLYVNDIINSACIRGHVQVLEWFKKSGYEFKYNEDPISWASWCGNIQILEWFKNSGYEFKYNKLAFNESEINILKFYSYHINTKKIVTWSNSKFFIKTLKFKTPQKYLKGYQKN